MHIEGNMYKLPDLHIIKDIITLNEQTHKLIAIQINHIRQLNEIDKPLSEC